MKLCSRQSNFGCPVFGHIHIWWPTFLCSVYARSWQTLDPPKRESSSGPQWSSLRLSRLQRDPLDRGANFPGYLDSKAMCFWTKPNHFYTVANVTSLCWMKLLKWQQIDHESVLLLRFMFFPGIPNFRFYSLTFHYLRQALPPTQRSSGPCCSWCLPGLLAVPLCRAWQRYGANRARSGRSRCHAVKVKEPVEDVKLGRGDFLCFLGVEIF